MIEVEKSFQPTDEQLSSLLKDAEFVGNENNTDTYYDYIDYRLYKKDIWLRKRNNSFELKVEQSDGVREEIEDKKGIENFFQTSNLEDFIKNNLTIIIEYSTLRKKYKKDNFNIDVDEMSYGHKVCEIELMIDKEEDVKNAEDSIIALAKEYNFEIKKVPGKRALYFKLLKPELYKELYPNK